MDADSAADRNESDLAYVTELLDSVFKIKPERNGVVKVVWLGPSDSAKEVLRPLLVMFNDPESKGEGNVKFEVSEGCWRSF